MLKKAGAVAAAAAGLMMLSAPAFASTYSPQGEGWDHHPGGTRVDHNRSINQNGLVNTGDIDALHNVNVPVCVTGNDIAVGLVAVAADLLDQKGLGDSCNAVTSTGSSHN